MRELRMQGAALHATRDAILIIDRNGIVLWHNHAYSRLAIGDARSNDTLGRALWQLPVLPSTKILTALEDAVRSGGPFESEFAMQAVDGSVQEYMLSCTPFQDDAGAAEGFVVALHDLSTERQALRALRQSDHQMLEQAVAQLNSPQTTAEERADLLRTPAGTLLQAQP